MEYLLKNPPVFIRFGISILSYQKTKNNEITYSVSAGCSVYNQQSHNQS
jgi:hypothetical protein